MAITYNTDSAGNLQVALIGPTGGGAVQEQGTTATGNTALGNPVLIGLNAAGANGAAAKAQFAVGDAANSLQVNTEGQKATYSSAFTVTPASAATDIAQLIGSATKIVKLTRLTVSGVATAAVVIDTLAIKRSAADTGGTIVAQTIVNHDNSDGTATAVCSAITANPSLGATGSKYGTCRFTKLTLGLPAGTSKPDLLVWDFTNRQEKGLTLRGVADALVVNLNGVQSSGQVMDIEYTWTEE